MLGTPQLVARIRAATGETQEALARRMGVSFPTVNAWERGRSVPRPRYREMLESMAAEAGIVHEFTVLVIDDDPTTAHLVGASAELVDSAVTVHASTDGYEGLVKCGSLKPSLVFLDILMPGIDGFEVAKLLPGIEGLGDTTIVFVTSSREKGIIDRARRLGHDVMFKPLDLDALAGAMRSRIDETP